MKGHSCIGRAAVENNRRRAQTKYHRRRADISLVPWRFSDQSCCAAAARGKYRESGEAGLSCGKCEAINVKAVASARRAARNSVAPRRRQKSSRHHARAGRIP